MPSNEEVAEYLSIDIHLVNEVSLNIVDTISLDEDREDTNLYNIVSNDNKDIDLMLDLESIINSLESPDREIVIKKLIDNYTQEELAKEFNMTQVGISRLLSRNYQKIKNNLSV